MKKLLLIALLHFPLVAVAANYSLPADFGTGAFSGCSASGGGWVCGSNLTIGEDDQVSLSNTNINLSINGNLRINKNADINVNSGFVLTITVSGNVEIKEDSNVEANITSTAGKIEVKDDVTISGNLTADDKIEIGKNSTVNGNLDSSDEIKIDDNTQVNGNLTAGDKIEIKEDAVINGNLNSGDEIKVEENVVITGDLNAVDDIEIKEDVTINGNVTAGDNLDIDNGTVVNGVCTPSHPLCTNVTDPNALVCETFRDEFSTVSYSRQDGTVQWFTNWVEVGDGGLPHNGAIRIANGRLQLEGQGGGNGRPAFSNNSSIEREANLSTYQRATLSFDYFETGQWEGNDHIEVWISTNGGISWSANAPIHTFSNDQGANPQTLTLDISSYISGQTRVALVERANASDEIFFVDNFQIEACYNVPPTDPVAEYRLDESSWSGIAGEVIDSSGSGLHGRAIGGASAVEGKVCNGASLSGTGQYLEVASNSVLEITDELTVSAWIFPDQIPASGLKTIVSKDQNYEFHVNSSGQIFWRWGGGSRQLTTTGAAIPTGQWSHVAIVYSDAANSATIYINAQQRATRFANGALVPNTLPLQIGADQGIASRDFDGKIDEVRIYNFALSGTDLNTVMNETRPCVNAAPDHYHFSHPGNAITCEPTTVTVTAHNADHSLFTVSADTNVTISSTPAVDAITPSVVTILNGNSSANFNVSNGNIAPSINLNVIGSVTETSGSAETNPNSPNYDDPPLQFLKSLFAFTNGIPGFLPATTTLETQIAGKPSSSPPTSNLINVITLRAIQADDTSLTEKCRVPLRSRVHNIRLGYQCIDSSSCGGQDKLLLSDDPAFDPATAVTIRGNDNTGTANTTTVPISFNTSGYAFVAFRYDDVGRIRLFADTYEIATGNLVHQGLTPPFLVRPFAVTLDFGDSGDGDADLYDMRADDWNDDGVLDGEAGANPSYSNPVNSPESSTPFRTAGVDFPAELTAVLWQSEDDDSPVDGIPDVGVNLHDNGFASRFGQESGGFALLFEPTVASPSGGSDGTLTASFSTYSGGKSVGTMNWSEVGIVDIKATLVNYLGDTTYVPFVTVEDVGRFRPKEFQVVGTPDSGIFANACGGFSYAGQEFGYQTAPSFVVAALNGLGGVTSNYTGVWNKLTSGSFTLATATTNTGSDSSILGLVFTPAGLTVADNTNGTFNVTLGAETFCYGTGVPCTKQSIAEVAPFTANITRTLQNINDGDGTSTNLTALLTPTLGAIRYGRLAMDNVFGSELSALTMPLYSEYYDGVNYLLNSDDLCTEIMDDDVEEVSNPASLTYTRSVLASPPALSAGGVLNISLSAPTSVTKTGTVTLTLDLTDASLPNHTVPPDPVVPRWLLHDWDPATVGLENPSAQATFGIYKGNSRQIYYRQIFR